MASLNSGTHSEAAGRLIDSENAAVKDGLDKLSVQSGKSITGKQRQVTDRKPAGRRQKSDNGAAKLIDRSKCDAAALKQQEKTAAAISKKYELHPVTARCLAARGFKPGKELERFLNPSLEEELADIHKMKDLDALCDLVCDAVCQGKKIFIGHDYDVDGTSAAAIVLRFLRKLPGVEVASEGSRRFSGGYAAPEKRAEEWTKQGYGLYLFLDYGTTSNELVSRIKELNPAAKVGVLDHHEPEGERPLGDALVNPKQAECGFADGNLCTGGLAYIFAMALKERLADCGVAKVERAAEKIELRQFLPWAALATVADVVPLIGANRAIVKEGLIELRRAEDQGLIALRMVSGKASGRLKAEDVAFGIGPRINAAGRLRDLGADLIVQLATTDEKEFAEQAAMEINGLNEDRKNIERQGLKKAKKQAERIIAVRKGLPAALVIADKSLHPGVVGIIASRLKDIYNRPAFVFTWDKKKKHWVGSGRGIDADVVSISDAIFDPRVKKFHDKPGAKAGGHKKAGGATILENDLPGFSEAFESVIEEQIADHDITPYVKWDAEVTIPELNSIGVELIEELENVFQPSGVGNPAPRLLLRGMTATMVRGIKQAKEVARKRFKPRHLLCRFRQEPEIDQLLEEPWQKFMNGTLWFHESHPALAIGKQVDAVAELSLNDRDADFDPENQRIQLNLVTLEKAA